jgi:hypothetical protein
MADFLILSLSTALSAYVKKKNTPQFQSLIYGVADDFLSNLKKTSRVVQDYVIDQKGANSDYARAQGIEKLKVSVKTFGFALALVLDATIGPTVVVTQTNTAVK